jgi:acetyl esterase/lipase
MPSFTTRALQAIASLGGWDQRWTDAAVTRAEVSALALRPAPYSPPKRLDRSVDITVRAVAGWPVYDVSPRRLPPRRAGLFLHGGGYINEIRPQHWTVVAGLAAATATRFTIPIYPLAPVGTAAQVVPAVVELAIGVIGSFGPERAVVMGDSAGAGMALAAALDLRDRGVAAPAQTVLISPWLDVTLSDPSVLRGGPGPFLPGLRVAADLYRGTLAAADPRVSPIHGDLTGLGPVTVFSGTRDRLHGDSLRLVARARAVGVPVTYHEAADMMHDYPLYPLPESRQARRQIRAVINGLPG